MSREFNGMMKGAFLVAAIVATSGCNAIPTAEDYALKQAGIDPNDAEAVQAYATESGLGTINRSGEAVERCERQRSTGSNIGRSSCRSNGDGSQPVREGKYTPQPPAIPPGLLNRRGPDN